jgi:uncharacterized membrane protein
MNKEALHRYIDELKDALRACAGSARFLRPRDSRDRWCEAQERIEYENPRPKKKQSPYRRTATGMREQRLHGHCTASRREIRMKTSSVLPAAAIGALATYLLDPDLGRRRRARVREKIFGKLSHMDEAAAIVAVDLRNRLKGVVASMRTRLASRDVPDEILVARVRAKLGRFLSHPGAVEVSASGGTVMLQGPILQHEAHRAFKAVRTVPGVRRVVDRLDVHEQQGSVSALQGGRPREQRIDIMQEHWAPSTRVVVGAGGATLVACALARRSPLTLLLGIAGAVMLVRAGTNMELPRLVGRRGPYIDYVKTIHIRAPLEQVFAFWQDFENFPGFMRNVRSVRKNADDSWHWQVAGPLGATVQWDSVVTASIPNELIAWATLPGSEVEHAGLAHFQRDGDGTRVQVEMGYNPPGAALGHLVASLFGADPLAEMDEDLMRLKGYFETGKPARDAAGAKGESHGQTARPSEMAKSQG